MNNNKTMVKDLIEAGAQVDVRDHENMKATDWTLDLDIDTMLRQHSKEAYKQHIDMLEHKKQLTKELNDVESCLVDIVTKQEEYVDISDKDKPTELETGVLQQVRNI